MKKLSKKAQRDKIIMIYREMLREGWTDKMVISILKDKKCFRNILKREIERDIRLSSYAARNSNCSSEVLVGILNKGKDDYISCWVVENPKCSPEILEEVLRRGKSDGVSIGAALNSNCPSGILVEVLQRGKDDRISHYVAENRNCPKEAIKEWRKNKKP